MNIKLALRALVLLSSLTVVTTCGASGNTQSESTSESESTSRSDARRGGGLKLRRVATLSNPVYLATAPGEPNRLYVVQQQGAIRVISRGRVLPGYFLNIARRVHSGGEQGLLSMAFDPAYRRNHFFYVNYTDVNGNTRVVRFRSRSGRAVLSSAKQLLFVRQPFANHNGGQLQFGPDGRLYVGMGDGGSGGDPDNRAQNLSDRLGKLLRANVKARRPVWQIAGYGLRNPWRFSFDRRNGSLYIGDVGQNSWEEVDFLPRFGLSELINYGWSVYEGSHSFKPSQPLNESGRLVQPVHEYALEGGRCSVIGGFVYRGSAQPDMRGRYVFGDFCTGEIWSLKVGAGRATGFRREPITVPSLTSFGQNGAGELYAVSQSGPVYRIT